LCRYPFQQICFPDSVGHRPNKSWRFLNPKKAAKSNKNYVYVLVLGKCSLPILPSQIYYFYLLVLWLCIIILFFISFQPKTHHSQVTHFTSKKLENKNAPNSQKISTSTEFHLWDVLKLKKRIIFHFRLFCSTLGGSGDRWFLSTMCLGLI